MPRFNEWLFILLLALLLFGGKKIPELARSLGKGVSEFKKGVREIENESNAQEPQQPVVPIQPTPPVAQGALPAAQQPQQPFRFDPYTGKPLPTDAVSQTGTPQ